MPGYGDLNRIQDEATRSVLKQAFDQIHVLQRALDRLTTNAVQKATTIDAGALRVSNAAPAIAPRDLVTLDQVRQLVDQVKKATY